MLFRYSYAAKVCAKNKSLCYRYVIFRLRSFQQELWLYILNVVNFAIKLLNEKISSNPQLSSSASFLRLNVLSSLN